MKRNKSTKRHAEGKQEGKYRQRLYNVPSSLVELTQMMMQTMLEEYGDGKMSHSFIILRIVNNLNKHVPLKVSRKND